MCGLTGVVTLDGRPPDLDAFARMVPLLAHRGPDAQGVHAVGPALLGHRRLSIVDIEGGQQPMGNDDLTVWVVFNGEIFNHVELRRDLEARGHLFRTRSDTEVLLRAYLERGVDCVRDFNGQWSFAIWDARTERLFASRDRLGVRPFYFTRTERALVFGSEIKTLLGYPGVRRELDPVGIDQILTIWSTMPPRTAFAGISELPPGSSLLLERGDVRTWRHFELDYSELDARSDDDIAEELRATLIDAARLRFQRADVPVGAYLSGGLDSAVITGMVRRFTDAPLKTFSVTFEDAEFDESEHQRRVVDYLGVDHHEVRCRAEDIGRVFPDVVWHAEQPMVRTGPAPMFLLSRLVRDHGHKVVLTGEGADELLGGYDIFKEAKVRRFWARQPGSKLRPLLLRKLYPYIPGIQRQPDAYLQSFFHARPEDLDSPFFSHLPRWELTRRLSVFYSDAMRARLEGVDPYAALAAELPEAYGRWDPFCQAQYLETRYLLPGYILSSQGDRMGMAHGIEGRFPFLDHRVAALAARIPPRLKMRVLDEKHVLKRAAGDLIPPFLHERPKQPYRAPETASFFDPDTGRARFEWVEELLSERQLADGGVFNPRAVRRLVDKARGGRLIGVKDGMGLVVALSTQLLKHRFIDGMGSTSDGN